MSEFVKFPHYQQEQALRDIKDRNFPAGTIQFEWGDEGSQYRWNPIKSYFRIRLRYEVADQAQNGSQPTNSFGLAPNMFTCDGLWQSIYQDINGVCVSEIQDYNQQIASLKNRMLSKSHLDSVQKSLNMSEITFNDRLQRITSDGVQNTLLNVSSLQPINNANNGKLLNFLDLTTPNQIQFTAANQLIFTANAGQAIPDLSEYFQIGEYIHLNDGAEKVRKITSFQSTNVTNDTIVVDGAALTVVGVANLVAQVRKVSMTIHKKDQSSARSNSLELIWRPCLGFWNYNGWLPAGNYKLRLTPNPRSEYMRYCVESLRDLEPANFGEVDANKFRVVVEQIQLYVYKGQGPAISDKTMELDYDEVRMQSKALTTASLTQNVFVINPTAYAFTLAYQDNLASGNDIRFSPMKFKIRNNEEQAISRLYIQRGSKELPTPKPDPNIDRDNGIQYINQLYVENLMYTGQYFDQGGQETTEDWINRGLYYHYKFEDGSGDERLAVSQQFNQTLLNNGSFTSNPNILLFDHYYRKCVIQVKNGRIFKVMASQTN